MALAFLLSGKMSQAADALGLPSRGEEQLHADCLQSLHD